MLKINKPAILALHLWVMRTGSSGLADLAARN
jgi:hypothetical protein